MLPRILVIDDVLGRLIPGERNPERTSFCGAYLLKDITGDEVSSSDQSIRSPIADAVFCRGQEPISAAEGGIVKNSIEDVISTVERGWNQSEEPWSLVLLDLTFKTGKVTSGTSPRGVPEGSAEDSDSSSYFGFEVLATLRGRFPDLPVLIFSGNENSRYVSRKLDEQASVGFLEKGKSSSDSLKKAIQKHGLIGDDAKEDDEARIVGKSRSLLRALRTARLAAFSRKNILMRGENGTGKELLASYIRRKSSKVGGRKERPFQSVNSARLTPELYQSELFGYKAGSWQDAVQDRAGALKTVEGGDLFLDEIAELHPEVQAGLLRLLETREYSPYGAFEETEKLRDVRFLSATNADLLMRIGRGEFRQDLYYRLREFGDEVYLPPLRERPEDIPLLAECFVRRFETQMSARTREITSEALALMYQYQWPGNIREMRNCLYSAVSRFDEAQFLTPAHLPDYLSWSGPPQKPEAMRRLAEDSSTQITGSTRIDREAGHTAQHLAKLLKSALESFLEESETSEEP